jgi:hypothetical protein
MISNLSMRVLILGLDDWVPLAAVVGLARQLGALGDAEAADAGADSIRELTERHLVEVGNVTDGGFFVHEGVGDSILGRIADAMRTTDSSEWGFSYWMQNTDAGDELARAQRPRINNGH